MVEPKNVSNKMSFLSRLCLFGFTYEVKFDSKHVYLTWIKFNSASEEYQSVGKYAPILFRKMYEKYACKCDYVK